MVLFFFDRAAAFLVEDGECRLESPEQFDKPLMQECFWDQNEDAFRPTAEHEAHEDQASFDRLAQAYFVGEQDTGRVAGGDLLGDIELVRDELHPSTLETSQARTPHAELVPERFVTEIEELHGVGMPGQETVLRLIETEVIGQLRLIHFKVTVPVVVVEVALLFDVADLDS